MPTIDDYATPLKLPMTIDLFSRFPAIAGYKAEFKGGAAELNYRPRISMARMKVASRQARQVDGVSFQLIDLKSTHDALAKLFAFAFGHVSPLDTMAPTTRRHAADAAMKHVASGGEGVVFGPACFGAFESDGRKLVGAAITCEIKLRPDEWPDEEMPSKLVNLAWLFVSPDHQRSRIGTALVDHVVSALAQQRVPWLVSHIPQDNVPAVMFHWQGGFELVRMNATP